MNIQPIETRYKGFRFRSRLEARWAIFLDYCGIAWTYENEGYQLPSGWYLPDFDLVDLSTFLEIKPLYLYPEWDVPEYGIDTTCPEVCRKPMELGHHVKKTIVVFGDPYDAKAYWFAGNHEQMNAIFSHWRTCRHWAEFARSVRFGRGETPNPPTNIPVWSGSLSIDADMLEDL